jgi:hypothetical protein
LPLSHECVTCYKSAVSKCHGDVTLLFGVQAKPVHQYTNNRRTTGTSERTQAMMPTATSILQASLEKHNETFETLLSLIPAKYYLVRDDNNDQVRFHCPAVRAYLPNNPRVHLDITRIKKCSRDQNRRSKRRPRKRVVKRYACLTLFRWTYVPSMGRSSIQRTIKAYWIFKATN